MEEIENKIVQILETYPDYKEASHVLAEKLIVGIEAMYKEVERKVVLEALVAFTNSLTTGLKDGQMGRSEELAYVKRQIEVARTGLETELKKIKAEKKELVEIVSNILD